MTIERLLLQYGKLRQAVPMMHLPADQVLKAAGSPSGSSHMRLCGMQTEAKRLWKLNEALSLGLLSPLATMYAPLAPPPSRVLPHLQWQPQRPFHTSALCASVLDSVTLPYRLHQQSPTSPLGAATGACTHIC